MEMKEAERNADYTRCVDFLVRMLMKYGDEIKELTTEEVRILFPLHQCKAK